MATRDRPTEGFGDALKHTSGKGLDKEAEHLLIVVPLG